MSSHEPECAPDGSNEGAGRAPRFLPQRGGMPSGGFAIRREKRLKKWNRRWKLELIEKTNPQWLDLYQTLNG